MATGCGYNLTKVALVYCKRIKKRKRRRKKRKDGKLNNEKNATADYENNGRTQFYIDVFMPHLFLVETD